MNGCIHRWRIPEPTDPFAKRFVREDGTTWVESRCLRCGMERAFRMTPWEKHELYEDHRAP